MPLIGNLIDQGFGTGGLLILQGLGSSTPTLTLAPSTAAAVDGGSPVSLVGTLSGVTSGTLQASLSGLGTLSTTTPTSGVAFTYTPPASGSGTSTVTLSAVGVVGPTTPGPQTCTISYGPLMTYTFRDDILAGSAGLTILAQLTDDAGVNVGSPFPSPLVDFGGGLYHFAATLATSTGGAIRYYISGSPSTAIGLTSISPPANSTAELPPSGVTVAGSTADSLTLSGLPAGMIYAVTGSAFNQRLLNGQTGESRIIATQTFASGNYTFTFGTGTAEAGPFSANPATGDLFYPLP